MNNVNGTWYGLYSWWHVYLGRLNWQSTSTCALVGQLKVSVSIRQVLSCSSDISPVFHAVHAVTQSREMTHESHVSYIQFWVFNPPSSYRQSHYLLAGINVDQVYRLQRLQNAAARLVTKKRKHDHISPVLFDLHWLPVIVSSWSFVF